MTRVTFLVLFARLSAGAVVYVDADAVGLNTGSSWTDAYTDLQSALAAAVSGDEIWVAEGTYKPTSGADRMISFALADGVALYGGFAGTPGTEGDSGAREPGTYVTILSGDIGTAGSAGDNSYHVVRGADNATMDGFTVTAGNADGNPDNDGAGMYNENVTGLTVACCVFSANRATYDGGGMHNRYSSLTVVSCTFSGNTGLVGGGMHNAGSSPAVINCAFSGNSAGYGGGIFGHSSPTIINCTFSGNTGCAIYGGSPTVTNSILWGDSGPAEPEIYGSSCIVSHSDVGQASGFTDGGGNINLDPLFVDADGPDGISGTLDDNLRLQAASPCIDCADGNVDPITDMEGNPRWDDTGMADAGVGDPSCVDMGAHEFQGTTTGTWLTFWGPPAGVYSHTGASLPIEWFASGDIPNIKIELSRDGGNTWEEIAGSTANDRSHTWTVTDGGQPLPQQDCAIRLSDAADAVPSDTSGSFTIYGGVLYVDADAPGPTHDGLSWTAAFLHPQDAADVASAGAEIRIAEGAYVRRNAPDKTVLTMKDGMAAYGGYAGYGEPVPDECDPGLHLTTLDGENAVYHVVVGASNATLDGFTLTGGNANGSSPDDCGGGIYSYSATGLTVADCTLVGNRAGHLGGGVYDRYSALSVADCRFSGNAAGSGGGGIWSAGSSSLSVTNSRFVGNTAWVGGGIDMPDGSSPTIAGCTFSGNRADYGGGVATGASWATVSNCTFSGNSAVCYGGGIEASENCIVANCVLWGNSSPRGAEIIGPCAVRYSNVDQSGDFIDGGGNFRVDPLFVDANGADDTVGTLDDDLHLLEGSPCIDAADGSAALATDIEGNARHDDPGTADVGAGSPTYVDVGAYEFQGTTTGSWLTVWNPTAGAWLGVGAEAEIQWVATSDVSDVKIELSRDGGATWEAVAASTANDRRHLWTVTDGGRPLPQTDCLIKISDAVDDVPGNQSGSFVISDGVWHVDKDAPGPTYDGLSWATAFVRPQDAMDVASSGVEIRVAEGDYGRRSGSDTVVLTMKDGVALHGGYAGYGEPDPDRCEPAVHVTTLVGGADVYHVVLGASSAALEGFTVRGGSATESNLDNKGGGMFNGWVTGLSVTDCTFLRNAGDYGAGMYNYNCAGLTVANCAFTGNMAGGGGGVFNRNSSLSITNCVFTGNDADYSWSGGGGICNSGSSPVVTNCTFSGNTAIDKGGGIYNRNMSHTVTNSVFWGNSAPTGPDIRSASCTVTYSDIGQAGGFTDGGGNISADPLFVNPGYWQGSWWYEGDYHLQAHSPCIDAADGDAAPASDKDGRLRYDDPDTADTGVGAVLFADIGAYELIAGTVTLSLGAAAEGDGILSIGTVSITTAAPGDLDVSLTSSDESEATVPATVTIPDGQSSAAFDVTIMDDAAIDGPRTVTITASATGWADGTGVLVVNDNDPVYLSLPSQATEGEPPLVATIEVDEAPTADVDFALVSDDTTELTVPAAVTIQAGQLSATFLVTPVDDGEIDGDQTATVTASLAGWADGSGSMGVLDSANQAITVTLPASASEGDGTLAGAGTVSIPGTHATDLVVALSSDDTSELDVPGTVTITAGQTSATFDLIVVDDLDVDGARPVTLTASAAGWADGVASVSVLDDEVGTFVVTLPAQATEGDTGFVGTVEIPMALASDLTVSLQSDDESELTVPASVDILSGQASASFPVSVADDTEIDGPQQATVTASAAGWNPGSDTMDVLDNETQTITLTLPANATEGDGTLLGAGTVSILGTWSTDLVIDLSSSDTTELIIVAVATILQGNTSASFDIVVVDDGDRDGTQTVAVTAALAGWTPGAAEIDILDDEPTATPFGGGCAPGAGGTAGLAFCVLIPYLALGRRRRGG